MLKDPWTNTNDLKQDRCAQGVWFSYGKVLPEI